MKFLKHHLWYLLPLWVGCWMLALFFGGGIPDGNGIPVDLSGRYTVSKKDFEGLSHWGYPFLNCNMLEEGSEITVTQDEDDVVVFSSICKNGFHEVNKIRIKKNAAFSWLAGNLFYINKMSGVVASVLPGVRTLVRESRLIKRENGDLQIDYTQTEKGLVLFLFPFSESNQSFALLRLKDPVGVVVAPSCRTPPRKLASAAFAVYRSPKPGFTIRNPRPCNGLPCQPLSKPHRVCHITATDIICRN